MLSHLRTIFERAAIRDSVPALARWGKRVPRSLIRSLQTGAFRAAVQYAARHQKFFARKLHESGIDPRRVFRPEDLGNIFTTGEDLVNLPPEYFLCHPPQAVYETTGTSGARKRIYFTYDELGHAARYAAAAFYENGVQPGDRVVCAFDAGYWISSGITFLACQSMDVFCSAIGKPHPRELYSRLPNYRYNVIVADPTWLVSLSSIAAEEGTFPLKLIFAAGDRMTDGYRNYVQNVWKAPVILSYGSTEMGGGLGMECRQGEGYHVDEFNFLLEIIEPDAGGYGELVMTTLSRRTMPLIRYRVGDVTRFIDGPCPCGVTLRRIAKIKGRRDEMVVMGAGNLHPEILERVLQGVEGVSENWQVAVRQEGIEDHLEFRLELTDGISAPVVENAVRKNLQSLYPEIWGNYVCGMFQLTFRYLAPGALGQGRKPKRLVDERTE